MWLHTWVHGHAMTYRNTLYVQGSFLKSAWLGPRMGFTASTSVMMMMGLVNACLPGPARDHTT